MNIAKFIDVSVIIVFEESFLTFWFFLIFQNYLVNVNLVLGSDYLLLSLSGNFNRSVVIAASVVVFLIVISDVEHLIINGFVTVVDLFAMSVSPTVLSVCIWVFRLSKNSITVSMNHEGISLSFISL